MQNFHLDVLPMTGNNTEPKKPKSFFRNIVTFLIISILSVSLVRVVLANILATSGQQLAAANQKIEILNEENQKVENEISKLESLSRVERLAKKKGFVKTKNVQVLTPSGPIANK